MKVWCVYIDHNDCDIPSWLVETDEICATENRAAQFVFDKTGIWPTERDKHGQLVLSNDGKDYAVGEYEVVE